MPSTYLLTYVTSRVERKFAKTSFASLATYLPSTLRIRVKLTATIPHCSYLDIYISQKIKVVEDGLKGQSQTRIMTFLFENSDL